MIPSSISKSSLWSITSELDFKTSSVLYRIEWIHIISNANVAFFAASLNFQTHLHVRLEASFPNIFPRQTIFYAWNKEVPPHWFIQTLLFSIYKCHGSQSYQSLAISYLSAKCSLLFQKNPLLPLRCPLRATYWRPSSAKKHSHALFILVLTEWLQMRRKLCKSGLHMYNITNVSVMKIEQDDGCTLEKEILRTACTTKLLRYLSVTEKSAHIMNSWNGHDGR